MVHFAPIERSQLADLFHEQSCFTGKACAFCSARPNELDALRLDPHPFEHALQQEITPQCLVVLLDIMALTRMTTGDHHTIRAVGKGAQDEGRVEAPRTHQADQAHVRRVLRPGGPGQVSSAVTAPIAGKTNDRWFKFFAHTSTPYTPTG